MGHLSNIMYILLKLRRNNSSTELAQLEERPAFNRVVVGSSPIFGVIFVLCRFDLLHPTMNIILFGRLSLCLSSSGEINTQHMIVLFYVS